MRTKPPAIVAALAALALAGCTSGAPTAPVESPERTQTLAGGLSPEENKERSPKVDFSQVKLLADGRKIHSGDTIPAGSVLHVRGLPDNAQADIIGELTGGVVTTLGGLSPVQGKAGIWKSGKLPPKSSWVISMTAPGGQLTQVDFTVDKPESREKPYIYPSGGTYGVGIPVSISFSTPVSRKGKVQERVSINTSRGVPEGAWSWASDTSLVFRPRHYWPAHTSVQVRADLDGLEVSPGVWGKSVESEFSIGRELILTMRTDKHVMQVHKDGRFVRTIPVSGGMPGWETSDGTKVISEKYEVKRLYNPDPVEGWDVTVPWALRITYSGEFIHSAPWNTQIGYANTSHGCTNMTVEDAKWIFNRTLIGDVVESSGSGVPVASWNGLGGLWNVTWQDWLAQAASPTPRERPQEEVEGPLSPMNFPG